MDHAGRAAPSTSVVFENATQRCRNVFLDFPSARRPRVDNDPSFLKKKGKGVMERTRKSESFLV